MIFAGFLGVVQVFLVLILKVESRCVNWCNQRGYCTAPDESGYCDCSIGYGGDDCSIKLCPKAFDPISLPTFANRRRTIRIKLGLSKGILSGSFEFHLGPTFLQLPFGLQYAHEYQHLLSYIESAAGITCSFEDFDSSTNAMSMLVKIEKFPEIPFENNLYTHNGNPPLEYFKCVLKTGLNITSEGEYCLIEDVVNNDIPIYSACANHGSCNRFDGTCECQLGFNGPSCSDTRDSRDRSLLAHNGPFFTGSMLRVAAQRSESSEFNLFSAHIFNDRSKNVKDSDFEFSSLPKSSLVTSISGDRVLSHNGKVNIQGPGEFSVAHGDESDVFSLSYGSFAVQDKSKGKAKYLMKGKSYGNDVFSVDLSGGISASSLSISNGSVFAEAGLLTTHNLKVKGTLDVVGSMNIEESLTIGSQFALTNGGMTVDVDKHSGTLFELRSRQANFNGSLIEVHAAGVQSTMFKSVVDGQVTFELSSSGKLVTRGLKLLSGGIEIQSGGLTVSSGGAKIKGGLVIQDGGLVVNETDFTARSMNTVSTEVDGSCFKATNTNSNFVGSAIDLQLYSTDKSQAMFLTGKNEKGSQIVSIAATGDLKTAGGIFIDGDSFVEGHSSISSSSFKKITLSAGERIVIPRGASFVYIQSDKKKSSNNVVFPEDVLPGYMLVLLNTDEDETISPRVPAGTGVIFIFDGMNWVDIQALKVPSSYLTDVKELTAANDLNIGNVTMAVSRLELSDALKNSIAFFGANGAVLSTAKLTFSKSTLNVPQLKVDKILSDIDVRGNFIKNAFIVDSKFRNISISAAEISLDYTQGITYVDSSGKLRASSVVHVNTNGQLHFKDSDIRNQSVAYFENGELKSAPYVFIESDGTIVATGLAGIELKGDIRGNGYDLTDVDVYANEINSKSITTSELRLGSMKGLGTKVLMVDNAGRVVYDSYESYVSIDRLNVDKLRVTSDIDMGDSTLKNARLQNVAIDDLKNVSIDGLRIVDLIDRTSDREYFLTVSDNGKVGKVLGTYVRPSSRSLVVDGDVESTGVVKGTGLNIPLLASEKTRLLYVDQKGSLTVIPPSSILMDNVAVESLRATELSIAGKITVSSLIPGGIVSVSSDGSLSTLSRETTVDIPNLYSSSLKSDSFTTKKIVFSPADMRPGILSVSEDGSVFSATKPSISSIELESASVRGNLAVGSVEITSMHSTEENTRVLGVDSSGKLVSSPKVLNLRDVLIEKATVSDSLDVNQLVVKNIPRASDVINASRILVVDNAGVVMTANSKHYIQELHTEKIRVAQDIHAAALRLDGTHTGSGVSRLDSSGRLESTMKVDLDYISVDSLTVHSNIKFTPNLSTEASASQMEILGVDSNTGLLGKTSTLKATSVDSDIITTKTIHITKDLKLPFASTAMKDSILSVDSQGIVSASKSLTNVESISVSGIAELNTVKLSNIEVAVAANSKSAMILSLSPDGLINKMSQSDIELKMPTKSEFEELTVTSKASISSLSLPSLVESSQTPSHILTVNAATNSVQRSSTISITKLIAERAEFGHITAGTIKLPKLEETTTEKLRFVVNDINDGTLKSFSPDSVSVASSGDVSFTKVHIDTITSDVNMNTHTLKNAVLDSATVRNSKLHIDSSTSSTGNVVVVNADGSISGSSLVQVAPNGALKVKSITSSSEAPVSISGVTIEKATISEASSVSATEINVGQTLTVSGPSNFLSEVFIDGSLTVRGSVIGSGPYMDSSDARFKVNVTPIQGALEKILHMTARTYDFDTLSFPDRSFPSSRQLGWIADDVENIVPELVTKDAEGYRQISYAHSAALVAEAVKELTAEYRREIRVLKSRLSVLEESLEEILDDEL